MCVLQVGVDVIVAVTDGFVVGRCVCVGVGICILYMSSGIYVGVYVCMCMYTILTGGLSRWDVLWVYV